tara:strand:- start:44 stop:322 length:279 start_codon:yes stop_codon:yes gene_type:complete
MKESTISVNPECPWCDTGDTPEEIKTVGPAVHTLYTQCGYSPEVVYAAKRHTERLIDAFWEGLLEAVKEERTATEYLRVSDTLERYRKNVSF